VTYSIEFSASAAKALTKVGRPFQLRLVGAIELLTIAPRPPAAKMLRGDERGLWRVRVGDYRIVYTMADERLLILALRIGHRREVYDR
jgi:mRNA interferase RelE/StbE